MRRLGSKPADIAEAARALREGRLVAFPTETVYGLGADATSDTAVARIFAAKGRPRFNPLIVHLADADAAFGLGVATRTARTLAAAFWPGPLTLIVRRQPECAVSELATVGLPTIALRVPSHPVAQAILRAAGVPVAAPSANRSGHVSPTTAEHVAADLAAGLDVLVDGGEAAIGLESTVVDATGDAPVLLRPGAITREDLARATGRSVGDARPASADAPSSPGQLASHYAPAARVRLDASGAEAGEALLAFGADVPAHAGPVFNLSPAGDAVEAAANLFRALRALDASGCAAIAVMPIPDAGLGEAINDRLRRAAAPRD
ncbi:MAG: L-threonylcarbamoyladenylate synthase [Hyphomicrobiaceae bacterium]